MSATNSKQTRQANVLTPKDERRALAFIESGRMVARNRVMFLLSIKAGLRAKEIAGVTWLMVTGVDGEISDHIALEDKATKGKSGRVIFMHSQLKAALLALKAERGEFAIGDRAIIYSQREPMMRPATVKNWFAKLYGGVGLVGCSSHSGRRTFITRLAKAAPSKSMTLRDVQKLAGHSALTTTERYIEFQDDRVPDLIEAI